MVKNNIEFKNEFEIYSYNNANSLFREVKYNSYNFIAACNLIPISIDIFEQYEKESKNFLFSKTGINIISRFGFFSEIEFKELKRYSDVVYPNFISDNKDFFYQKFYDYICFNNSSTFGIANNQIYAFDQIKSKKTIDKNDFLKFIEIFLFVSRQSSNLEYNEERIPISLFQFLNLTIKLENGIMYSNYAESLLQYLLSYESIFRETASKLDVKNFEHLYDYLIFALRSIVKNPKNSYLIGWWSE